MLAISLQVNFQHLALKLLIQKYLVKLSLFSFSLSLLLVFLLQVHSILSIFDIHVLMMLFCLYFSAVFIKINFNHNLLYF